MKKQMLAGLLALGMVGCVSLSRADSDMKGMDMKGMDMASKGGQKVTLEGEVLDMDCFMNEGAHGKDHQSCAVHCLNMGAPVGLLTKDQKVYFLTANEDKGMFKYYQQVRKMGGDEVKITGLLEDQHNMVSLRVDSVEKVK